MQSDNTPKMEKGIILVIENNVDDHPLLERLYAHRPFIHQTLFAKDAAGALGHLRAFLAYKGPRAIILDLKVPLADDFADKRLPYPEYGGIQILHALRKRGLPKDTSVLLRSFYGEYFPRDHWKQFGIRQCIKQKNSASKGWGVEHLVLLARTLWPDRILTDYISPKFSGFGPIPILGSAEVLDGIVSKFVAAARGGGNFLVDGPTGTGKELIAHAVRLFHPDQNKQLGRLNVATIDEKQFLTEFFGVREKTYTGVGKKSGICQTHVNGIIFLDQFDDLKHEHQKHVMDALWEKSFSVPGDKKIIALNAQFILAGGSLQDEGSDLEERYRRDVFERTDAHINLVPLHTTPDDIDALASYYLPLIHRELILDGSLRAPVLSEDATQKLKEYSWPQNRRQLLNALIRAHNEWLESEDMRDGVLLPKHFDLPRLDRQQGAMTTGVRASMISVRAKIDADAKSTEDTAPACDFPELNSNVKLRDRPIAEKLVLTLRNAPTRATGVNKSRVAKILGIQPPALFRRCRNWLTPAACLEFGIPLAHNDSEGGAA